MKAYVSFCVAIGQSIILVFGHINPIGATPMPILARKKKIFCIISSYAPSEESAQQYFFKRRNPLIEQGSMNVPWLHQMQMRRKSKNICPKNRSSVTACVGINAGYNIGKTYF
ncbi:MAG: hypothetical protein AAF900_01140 [Bacteroidota bacterium]